MRQPRTSRDADAFLPMTRPEMDRRGWDTVDVVFVTGDAYVDHPSFAMAILGRLLEAEGYRVAILSQPDWHTCEPWKTFGRPRLAFAVSAGNLDSMINHYTANKKIRTDDAYSPNGEAGRRPDRATMAYCQRAREAYRDVPIVTGGVEASLRRLAHYDYWSDKVRRSILLDAKADLLVYGMGERPLLEILHRLRQGEPVRRLRDIRGTAYRLGASESLDLAPGEACSDPALQATRAPNDTIELPSYEEVATDRSAFARMTRLAYLETNPYCGRRLIQRHATETLVVNPPAMPLEEAEMDRIYGLPFTREAHPAYGDRKIPALEVVRDSVQILRGCFGGCSFCSLSAHQGRVIQCRSRKSIVGEIQQRAASPGFRGTITDLGGPSANMYGMACGRAERRDTCRRTSCLHPSICRHLNTDCGPLIELMRQARDVPGVRQVVIASGVRTDLAIRSPAYVRELAEYHVGGQLSVAPEHTDPDVLRLMHKPPIEQYEAFQRVFETASGAAGKRQFLVPYLIVGHPGCDLAATIRTARWLKRNGLRPRQVQDFIPAPFDLATCMYHTGVDPMTGRAVYVPRTGRERRLQRALLQYFLPENYRDVREALEQSGRRDLIGPGPECLIGDRPPSEKRIDRRASGKQKPPARRRRSR